MRGASPRYESPGRSPWLVSRLSGIHPRLPQFGLGDHVLDGLAARTHPPRPTAVQLTSWPMHRILLMRSFVLRCPPSSKSTATYIALRSDIRFRRVTGHSLLQQAKAGSAMAPSFLLCARIFCQLRQLSPHRKIPDLISFIRRLGILDFCETASVHSGATSTKSSTSFTARASAWRTVNLRLRYCRCSPARGRSPSSLMRNPARVS